MALLIRYPKRKVRRDFFFEITTNHLTQAKITKRRSSPSPLILYQVTVENTYKADKRY